MTKEKQSLKGLFVEHKSFIIYIIISGIVTLIDISVCKISEVKFSPVTANTIGVITGFIIQYFLTTRHVYNKSNIKSFIVFFITFLIGLIFADAIIWICRNCLFSENDGLYVFLISKGLSIILPFFLMYFLRKKFMPKSETK